MISASLRGAVCKGRRDEFIYSAMATLTVAPEDRIASPEGPKMSCHRLWHGGGEWCADVDAASGDHAVSARCLGPVCIYSRRDFARYGVEVTFVDGTDLSGLGGSDEARYEGRLF
jgi:hypothetical protein